MFLPPDETRGRGQRLTTQWTLIDRRAGTEFRRELSDKAIATPNNRLDHVVSEHSSQLVKVRPQRTFAHRDVTPHSEGELPTSDEPIGVCHEVTKYRERLAL